MGGLPINFVSGREGTEADLIDLSDSRLTTQQKTAIRGLLAAHNPDAPAPPVQLSDIEQLIKDVLIFADSSNTQTDRDDAKARLDSRFQGRPSA